MIRSREPFSQRLFRGAHQQGHRDCSAAWSPRLRSQGLGESLERSSLLFSLCQSYMEKLQKLLVHAAKHGPLEQLYIYASMVSADFDNTGSAFAAMPLG